MSLQGPNKITRFEWMTHKCIYLRRQTLMISIFVSLYRLSPTHTGIIIANITMIRLSLAMFFFTLIHTGYFVYFSRASLHIAFLYKQFVLNASRSSPRLGVTHKSLTTTRAQGKLMQSRMNWQRATLRPENCRLVFAQAIQTSYCR